VAVLWRVGVVLGLVLIGMGSLLSYLRQEPSPAYWIITEKAPDFPQFYGYYLMDSSGAIRQRLDTATAASNSTWFVTWTPDGRYVFYRVNDNRDGQPHGLYVYDLRRNERRMVIEANIGRNSVTMNLSPDGHWYMVTIADRRNNSVVSGCLVRRFTMGLLST
jgi:Tol biopolymer transport system component